MKANAPEKIYIQQYEENTLICLNKWNISEEWSNKPCNEKVATNIEYSRTDAFIEKACFWLKNHYRDYMYNPTGKRLEAFFGGDMCNDFEDHMKRE